MPKKLYCQECGEKLTHKTGNEYHCPKCDMHYTITFYDSVEELEKATGIDFKEVLNLGTVQC